MAKPVAIAARLSNVMCVGVQDQIEMSPMSKYVTFVRINYLPYARRDCWGHFLFFFCFQRSTSNTYDQDGSSDKHDFVEKWTFFFRLPIEWIVLSSMQTHEHVRAHVRLMWTPNLLMRTYVSSSIVCISGNSRMYLFPNSFVFFVFDFVLPLCFEIHIRSLIMHKTCSKRLKENRNSKSIPLVYVVRESVSFVWQVVLLRIVSNAYIYITGLICWLDIFAGDQHVQICRHSVIYCQRFPDDISIFLLHFLQDGIDSSNLTVDQMLEFVAQAENDRTFTVELVFQILINWTIWNTTSTQLIKFSCWKSVQFHWRNAIAYFITEKKKKITFHDSRN